MTAQPTDARKTGLKIACIGEAMIELSFGEAGFSHPKIGFAGDVLNTAIYLKRGAGQQVDVSFVSALGNDRFSNEMLKFIRRESIRTDAILSDPARLPGLYAITNEPNGERGFQYWRDQSAARHMFNGPDGLDFSRLAGFDILYFSAITLAILPVETRAALLDWVEVARQNSGCRMVFDSNFRPRLWESVETARYWVEKAWKVTDIALPSLEDEEALFADRSCEATLARLQEYGLSLGAIKNGAAGPVPLSPLSNLPDFMPADTVVDTTAAGDSFNGAYLAAILTGADQPEALRRGHLCAAHVVGFRGAVNSLPSEVDPT